MLTFTVNKLMVIDETPGLPPLIERCVTGDRAAQREFVETYKGFIFRVALKVVRNHHLAEDLSQEVFIKVLRSLDTFKGETPIETWLYRVTVNKCLDHMRRSPIDKKSSTDDVALAGLTASGHSPEHSVIEAETQVAVAKAVAELPVKFRLVYLQHHWEQLSYEEIAILEKTSVSAIKMRISRGRVLLVEKLKDLWERR